MFYQFFIHTEFIGKLPKPIEFIFNTPSHHRVHHARNPEYLDKNFGGILIVWDRLFGTFAEEKITPVYGLVHPLNTWDIIWTQVHHLAYIFEETKKYSNIMSKLSIIVAPPGWTLTSDEKNWIAPEIPEIKPKQGKYNPTISSKVLTYLVPQFLCTIVVTIAFVYGKPSFNFVETLVLCIYLTYCLQSYGLIMNNHSHSFRVEEVRIVLDFLVAQYFFRSMPMISPFVGLFSIFEAISFGWLFAIRTEFPSHKKADPVGNASRG